MGTSYRYEPLADYGSYLAATLTSSSIVTGLEELKEGKRNIQEVFDRLETLEGCLNEVPSVIDSEHMLRNAFLDYVASKGEEEYKKISEKLALNISRARAEVRGGNSGEGVEDLVKFADEFGDFCSSQADNLAGHAM